MLNWLQAPKDMEALLKVIDSLIQLTEKQTLKSSNEIGEISEAKIDQSKAKFKLSSDSVTMLSGQRGILSLLPALSYTRRLSSLVHSIILHLVRDDLSNSLFILNSICIGLDYYDARQARAYFRTFMNFVSIQDSIQSTRIDRSMNSLIDLLTKQLKYWKFADQTAEQIIRLGKKIPLVAQWINQQQNKLEPLRRFLALYPELPSNRQYPPQNVTLFKNSYRPTRNESAAGFKATSRSSTVKAELLACLCEKGSLESSNHMVESDSELDFSDRILRVGQLIDCIDTEQKPLPAQVIAVESGKAFIHYLGYQAKWNEWIEIDSYRIRNLGTLCSKALVQEKMKAKLPIPLAAE
jgi:hypothetical protein